MLKGTKMSTRFCTPPRVACLLCAVLGIVSAAGARQVCDRDWLSGHSIPGVSGTVNASLTFDVDGPGPATPELFIGGSFTVAGAANAAAVARWDGRTWRSVGNGISGSVKSLAPWDPDGPGPALPALFAGGSFFGGATAPSAIARWNGTDWLPVGGGMSGGVFAEVDAVVSWDSDAEGPERELLIAGGKFTNAGGNPALNVARWDGLTWQPLGAGLSGNGVYALAVFDPDGASGPVSPQLIAGGDFSVPGSSGVGGHIARWYGGAGGAAGSWQVMGSTMNAPVRALVTFDADGAGSVFSPMLVAAGDFSKIGGATVLRVAAWNGTTWSGLGAGFDAPVYALGIADALPGSGPTASPQLFAGGDFLNSGSASISRLARWNGSGWQGVGSGADETVRTIAAFDPDTSIGPQDQTLIIGGDFASVGGVGVGNVASWNGSQWGLLGRGLNRNVFTLATHDPDGASGPLPPIIVAGGDFTTATVPTANRVASWDGLEWRAFGTGLDGNVNVVTSFDADGAAGPQVPQVFVGGTFLAANGVTMNRVARWDGSAWQPLGSGMAGPDGTTFIRAMATWDADGAGPGAPVLVVGGGFGNAGGVSANNIAQWNGTTWQNLGGGTNSAVYALCTFDPDGPGALPERLIAGGNFTSAGGSGAQGVAQWNGATWQTLGSGTNNTVFGLMPFDFDGSGPGLPRLVGAGAFTTAGGNAALRVASWNGSIWQPVGGGISNFNALALASVDPDDGGPLPAWLVVGGSFTHAEGRPMGHLSRWDGVSWQPFGIGMSNQVTGLAVFDPDGAGPASSRMCAGGLFITADGEPSGYLAQWGVDSVLWANAGSGAINDPSRWSCGTPPTRFDRLVIDHTLAGYADSALGIGLPSHAAEISGVSLLVRTDAVTIDLNGTPLSLRGGASVTDEPGLVIGGLAGSDASLRLVNSAGGGPVELATAGLTLAENPNVSTRTSELRLDDASARVVVDGATCIGRFGNAARLEVENGAAALLEGELSVAEKPGSAGSLIVSGSGSAVSYGGRGTSTGIGVGGSALLSVTGGATLSSGSRQSIVTVGTLFGSTAQVSLSGDGTLWNTEQRDLAIGFAGDVVFGIEGGAELKTDTQDELYVSRYRDSSATVTLRDAGSRWRETASAIRIGPGGTIDVGAGAAVECPSMDVTEGGFLTGTGVVRGLTPNFAIQINNGGTISPRAAVGGVGVLTLNASLSQSAARDGVRTAGTIAADLGGSGPGMSDRIDFAGGAVLAGALRVRLVNGFDPPVGSRFTVLTARSVTGRFDVAVFPGLVGRVFRIEYPPAGARGIVGVDVVVEAQGDRGTFNASGYSAPGAPSAADLGDLDSDGFADLVLTIPDGVAPEASPGQVAVLLNAGNTGKDWNGFVPSAQVTFNTGRAPSAVTIARLRGGAMPNDIAVTCAADNTVQTFSNDGSGVFTPAATLLSGGMRPLDVDAADFTGDGAIDLVVVNFGDANPPPEQQLPDRGNARVLANNGSGAFAAADTLVTGWYPRALAIADFDGDGRPDIATADSGTSEVSVFLRPPNNGPGFIPRVRYSTPGQPLGVEPGGLDNPKDSNDLAVVLGAAVATPQNIAVMINTDSGDGSLSPPVVLDVGGPPRGLAMVDLDDDSDTDIAVIVGGTKPGSSAVQLLRNVTPDGSPGGVLLSLEPTPVSTNDPTLILAGDVDNDGLEDLLTINADTAALREGTGGRGEPVAPRVAVARATPPCAGDFNGDGGVNTLDLVRLLSHFGQIVTPGSPGDINLDGVVNTADLVTFLGRFGSTCS